MLKNKNNTAIWGARIKKDASTLFQKVGNSIDVDKKLFREDILGSIAHVEMLFRQIIISFKIKNKIIYGLNKIDKEILKNIKIIPVSDAMSILAYTLSKPINPLNITESDILVSQKSTQDKNIIKENTTH